MIDSFSCTPFISERRFFNNAVTSIADVHHVVILLWLLMAPLHLVTQTLTIAYVTSITTSAYLTRENSRFLSYPGQDNLCRIRISIPKLNSGFLYLVCKNVYSSSSTGISHKNGPSDPKKKKIIMHFDEKYMKYRKCLERVTST